MEHNLPNRILHQQNKLCCRQIHAKLLKGTEMGGGDGLSLGMEHTHTCNVTLACSSAIHI